ncbi:hypothetical protein TNCV_2651681 [Trichonephila clavipes]|nr:hypothetical protein TNCV_2651681 [Trichonephila clavipes]
MKGYFWYLDKTSIVDSTRHSKPDKKLSRNKGKALHNCKSFKYENPVIWTVGYNFGGPVVWGPRIIDTADTAVATPLMGNDSKLWMWKGGF